MTRWTIVALVMVCGALAAVGAVVVRLLDRDRAALLAGFRSEQLALVKEISGEIQSELDDIGEDLRFAAQLVHATDSESDRERELGALLAVVNQYRLIAVYDGAAARVLAVRDPLAAPGDPDRALLEALDETARRVLARPQSGAVETSPPVRADASEWLRAVATQLPARPGGAPGGAVAVLVDTAPFFSRLRLVTSAPDSRLIVLGTHGLAAPATDPRLAAAARQPADPASSRFAALVARMRAGRTGTLRIREAEAARLGLDRADALAAYAPIAVTGGGHWSIATVRSTSALRRQERAIMVRSALASGAVALCLLGFATYLVVASRRAIRIKERLRHADQVAHLHEKSEKILDNVPAGVMVLAADGRVTALNRVLRERVPSSAVGERLPAAFPEAPAAEVARLEALVGAARDGGRVRSLFGERLALFGAEGQYSVHAVPLEPLFPDARELLVIEDVSEVQSLASQLLRAEKLATVGVLAAGIAHEIGTPLGVVRARAELLTSKLGADHALTPGALVIVEQIDRITRTIRQLLDFARVKPANVTAVSVPATAAAVIELLRFEADRRHIAVEADLPDELPAVAADPDQLQQVLINLLLNACDACAERGGVVIRARCERPADAGGPERIRIEVSDDGAGIPEELRHQVFDPFFTTKKRGQGTGLGLTVAAQIVRNHGGRIDLDSETGRGTVVTLLWPSAAAARETAHDASA